LKFVNTGAAQCAGPIKIIERHRDESTTMSTRAVYNSVPMQLKVEIVRYVEHYFPGIVECELVDAEGHLHRFIAKVPIVSDEWLGPEDVYPKSGVIRCEILERLSERDGRDLVRVTTERPDDVESKEGVTEFLVLSSQVISADATIAEMERKAEACEDRAKSEPHRADVLLHHAATYREWITALKHGHWR
jgi:hypothetical protein